MINGITMTGAGIIALITSLIVEGQPIVTPPYHCASYSLPWLCNFFSVYTNHGHYFASISLFAGYTLALVIIANIIGFNLYGYLLSKYSATFLSFAGSITPFFAALFGWLFLGERIGWEFFVTGAIVFFGLTLFYQDEFVKKMQ
jgi:drug/metabolite transporter (DMT)-like permease